MKIKDEKNKTARKCSRCLKLRQEFRVVHAIYGDDELCLKCAKAHDKEFKDTKLLKDAEPARLRREPEVKRFAWEGGEANEVD